MSVASEDNNSAPQVTNSQETPLDSNEESLPLETPKLAKVVKQVSPAAELIKEAFASPPPSHTALTADAALLNDEQTTQESTNESTKSTNQSAQFTNHSNSNDVAEENTNVARGSSTTGRQLAAGDGEEKEQFVVVIDPESDEPFELPIRREDNSLPLAVLERAFPQAHGLKYKNPATGASRVLLLNPSGTALVAPVGGWAGKVFAVVTRPVVPKVENKEEVDLTASNQKADATNAPEVLQQPGPGNKPMGDPSTKACPLAEADSESYRARGKKRAMNLAEDENVEEVGSLVELKGEDKERDFDLIYAKQRSKENDDGDGMSVEVLEDYGEDMDAHKRGDAGGRGDTELLGTDKDSGGDSKSQNSSIAGTSSSTFQPQQGGSSKKNKNRGGVKASNKAQMGSDDDGSKCIELIVLGLPYAVSKGELRTYFEQFGTVMKCRLALKANGTPRGFGFVTMAKLADQKKLLQSTVKHVIHGVTCKVRPERNEKKKESKKREDDRASKLYIRRVPSSLKAERLREFFLERARELEPSTEVTGVYIPSKPFRNYAFITFNNKRVVKRLCNRHSSYVVDGHTLLVSVAESKEAVDAKKARLSAPFGAEQRQGADAPYISPWELDQQMAIDPRYQDTRRFLDPAMPMHGEWGGGDQRDYNEPTFQSHPQQQPGHMGDEWRDSRRDTRYPTSQMEPNYYRSPSFEPLPPYDGGGPSANFVAPGYPHQHPQQAPCPPMAGMEQERHLRQQQMLAMQAQHQSQQEAQQQQLVRQLAHLQQLQPGMSSDMMGHMRYGYSPSLGAHQQLMMPSSSSATQQQQMAMGDPMGLSGASPEVMNAALQAFWSVAQGGSYAQGSGSGGGRVRHH